MTREGDDEINKNILFTIGSKNSHEMKKFIFLAKHI